MIAHVTDYDTAGQPSYPVAYAIIKGELREGIQRFKTKDMFEADLIIVVKDGSFFVWKDRLANRGPVTFNEAWDRIRACVAQHRKHRNETKNSKRLAPQVTTTRRKDYLNDV